MRQQYFLPVLLFVCSYWLSACSDPAARFAGAGGPHQPNESTPPRIVSLSPHLAELVFAVGAGDMLVGVSAYTDYPDAAAKTACCRRCVWPGPGTSWRLFDRMFCLPGKAVTPAHVVDEIRARGYRVEVITTRSIDDISTALKQIGAMTGHEQDAEAIVRQFEGSLQETGRPGTTVQNRLAFFIRSQLVPLYTVNAEHYISELIEICGGTNVFCRSWWAGTIDRLQRLCCNVTRT